DPVAACTRLPLRAARTRRAPLLRSEGGGKPRAARAAREGRVRVRHRVGRRAPPRLARGRRPAARRFLWRGKARRGAGGRVARASPQEYGRALVSVLRGIDARILVEPGRLLVANAGVLLARVLLRKQGAAGRRFVVIDAGMNDLLRPALYRAYHAIEPVGRPRGATELADVVGPVCESADVLAPRRRLPRLEAGDL